MARWSDGIYGSVGLGGSSAGWGLRGWRGWGEVIVIGLDWSWGEDGGTGIGIGRDSHRVTESSITPIHSYRLA